MKKVIILKFGLLLSACTHNSEDVEADLDNNLGVESNEFAEDSAADASENGVEENVAALTSEDDDTSTQSAEEAVGNLSTQNVVPTDDADLLEEPATPASEAIPAAPVADAIGMGPEGYVYWIGYRYERDKKTLTVEVRSAGSPRYEILKEMNQSGQTEMVMRFINTKMRPILRKPLDASEFYAPVAYVRTRNDHQARTTDVILTLREEVEPEMLGLADGVDIKFALAEKYLGPNGSKAAPESNAQEFSTKGSYGRTSIEDQQGAVDVEMRPFHIAAVAQAELDASAPAQDGQAPGAAALQEQQVPADQGADVVGQTTAVPTQGFNGKPVVLEFFNAPMGQVLRAFGEQIGVNFIYPKSVESTQVSIKLRNVPWDAALSALLETYGFGMARVGENIIRIDLIANMNKYLEQRQQANESRVMAENTKVLVIRLSNAKAADVSTALTAFLTQQGMARAARVSSDARTNTIFLVAPPTIIARAKQLIARLDVPSPQVEIASRLIEVQRKVNNFLGISWNGGLEFDASRGLGFGTLNFPNNATSSFSVDPGVNQSSGTGNIALNLGSINNFIDLGLRLRMEEARGTTEVLQSQRLFVRDRETASISAGTTAFFRPTGSPIIIGGASQQGGSGESSSDGGVRSVSFNLSLNVTPEVTNDGQIRMKISLNSSVPSPSTLAGSDLSSDTRSLTTVMTKRSGETGVIGGIYDTRKITRVVGIPGLSALPIIGALFRRTDTEEAQIELMMLITPTIKSSDGDDNLYKEENAPAVSAGSEPVADAEASANSNAASNVESNSLNTTNVSNNEYESNINSEEATENF